MTSIEKLHISGIRSFNPNPTARQTIEFHKPLTIILGKNGAGKTTIIEALLNATTGEMPPGAAAAEKCAFVYDPKALSGESEVKAQIRLVFTGKGGKAMQVIRSFQATRTKGKLKFETLDAALACKDDSSGKVQSATYRSTDCDRMVPELLGVPKAVLEHVIFCHQEDCNWPLGPPGEVKKRFDDIFASTRYVAALDKLREVAKEYKDRQKENEAHLIALREHREMAKQLTTEIEEKQEQVRMIETRNKEIEPRLKQLTTAVQAIDAESHRIETMAQEAAVLRGRVAEKDRALRQLQQQRVSTGQPAVPPHTLEELVAVQRDFSSSMQRIANELQSAQGKLSAAEASRRSVSNSCGEARGVLTSLEHESANHKRRVADLQTVISSITADFVAGEQEIDTAALDRITKQLEVRVAEAKAALQTLNSQHQTAMSALNSKRDETLRFADVEGKERDMKEAQIAAIQQRLTAIEKDSPPLISPGQIQALQHEIDIIGEKIRQHAAAKRAGDDTRDVSQLLSRIESCQAELKRIGNQITQCRETAETVVRMGFLRSTIHDRRHEVQVLLENTIAPGLRSVGAPLSGEVTLQSATEAAAAIKLRKAKALAQADDDARQVDRESSALQQALSHAQQRCTSLNNDIQQRRAAVIAAVGSDNEAAVKEKTTSAEDRLQRATRKLTSLQSLAKCYESFIASAQQEHSCVVCKRGLSGEEVHNFVAINQERQKTTPAQIEAAKVELTESNAAVEQLRKVAPLATSLRQLVTEWETIKTDISRFEEQLQVKKASFADLSTKRRDLQRQLDAVEAVVGQLSRVEQITTETEKIEVELRSLQAQNLTAASGNMVVPRDVLQREYDAKHMELQDLNNRLLQLQRNSASSGESEAIRALEEELLSKRSQLGELQVSLKRQEDVEKLMTALRTEVDSHRHRLNAIGLRKGELQKTLDTTQSRMKALEEGHSTASHAALAQVAIAEKNLNMLNESARAVRDHLSRASAGDRTEMARAQLRNNEAALRQVDDEVKTLNESINKMRTTMDEQHRQHQNLLDAIRLLELQREVERDKALIAKAEAALTSLRDDKLRDVAPIVGNLEAGDGPNESALSIITKARDRCRAKAGELERVRAQNTGALETLLASIAEKKTALSRDKYKDVDNRYAATFIKVQTTEHAIDDVEKYFRALERAVSSYHAEKVAQINKIVSDLWRSTYRGSDIDSIEIKSEDDTSTMARRSYKYRVTMKRGDTELDMRGRCSAGQKVLASVIIRMALSEAFCCDCGILALDEPTTNLDDDNSKALAESLRELISARRYVTHFQLIVITHDEDFVRTLGAGHRADSFYYVQKDRDGTFSTISERKFGDLFA